MPIWGFTKRTANKLLRLVSSEDGGGPERTRTPMTRAAGVYHMEATSDIAAATDSTTPGTGTAKIKWLNPNTGKLEDFTPNGASASVTVYNDGSKVVSGAVFRAVLHATGQYWVMQAVPSSTLRFTLDAALTTSNDSKAATVDDSSHSLNGDTITVYNCETSSTGVYIFEGDSGDAGLASQRGDGSWWIVNMECP